MGFCSMVNLKKKVFPVNNKFFTGNFVPAAQQTKFAFKVCGAVARMEDYYEESWFFDERRRLPEPERDDARRGKDIVSDILRY